MTCLICNRQIPLQLSFRDLFTLSGFSDSICEKCEKEYKKISDNHCPRCCKEGESEICRDCQNWENQGVLINHRAIFRYNDAMREYFSNYKFVGNYQLRHVFAYHFKPAKNDKVYEIVPIPISDKRMQERGFNQVTGFLWSAKIT